MTEKKTVEYTNELQFFARDGTYVSVYGNQKAIEEVIALLTKRDMKAIRRSAQIGVEKQK